MSASGSFKRRVVVALLTLGCLFTEVAFLLALGVALTWLLTSVPPVALAGMAVLFVLAVRVRRSLREAGVLIGRPMPQA